MKTFEDLAKKRQELLDELGKENLVFIYGVWAMVWGVGHNDAPGLKQPDTVEEYLWAADVEINQYPTVSRLAGYRLNPALYKKCYEWVHDLSRIAQGSISWDDVNW